MRVEKTKSGEVVGVVLSRRNLLALLEKLDGNPPDSHCTLLAPEQYGAFFVNAEEDGPHYYHPEREEQGVAGVMYPEYEQGMALSKGVTIPAP